MMLFKRDSVFTVNLKSVICLKQRARKDAVSPKALCEPHTAAWVGMLSYYVRDGSRRLTSAQG